MQTFLPYEDFIKTAKSLDYKRLGKQRIEAMQILDCLIKEKKGWSNHPAVLMWKSYEESLKLYANTIILEWIERGYKNNMKLYNIGKIVNPWWLGVEKLHRSHRARLIEKYKEFYLPKFPNDKNFNNGKYFWPVNEFKEFKII